MKFGPVPVRESLGGVVAHAVRRKDFVLKKGDIVTEARIAALEAEGVDSIVVALLEHGDVGEDEAAAQLARAVAGANLRVAEPFTGRANLFATQAGVLQIDKAAIDRINALDERITIATLPAFRTVETDEMVATVKIIPFAVPGDLLRDAFAAYGGPVISIAPFRPLRVAVISTVLPGLKPSVIAKTIRNLEARIAPAKAEIAADVRVEHAQDVLASAIRTHSKNADLTIVFGASAITDRRDVIPAAIIDAGGLVEQLGMPVDPGNLLLVGRLSNGNPVLGAPGCARSPRENGFDWVLHRLLAGLDVKIADIRGMGTGGLLMEIVSRPQPRAGEAHEAASLDSDD